VFFFQLEGKELNIGNLLFVGRQKPINDCALFEVPNDDTAFFVRGHQVLVAWTDVQVSDVVHVAMERSLQMH
jgi:hypothetical protein